MRHVLALLIFILHSANALQTDGIHTHQDYVNFSLTRQGFAASCLVQGDGSQMTGVLVKSTRVVMTAAHGMVKAWKKASKNDADITDIRDVADQNIHVYFGDRGQRRHKVRKIAIDPRFFNGDEGEGSKYDIAFLQLEIPVEGIEPVRLIYRARIAKQSPMFGVSYGTLGAETSEITRRAFALLEIDPIEYGFPDIAQLQSRLIRTLFSSVYFSPHDSGPVGVLSSEEEIRSHNARIKWQEIECPPYGLCLPGSSGGPVLMTVGGKDFLFGLINSFTHLSNSRFKSRGDNEAGFILGANRDQLYGHYQTVITPLYNQEVDLYKVNPHFYTFVLDEEVLRRLESLS